MPIGSAALCSYFVVGELQQFSRRRGTFKTLEIKLGDFLMKRALSVQTFLLLLTLAAGFVGCSRDPNVRKQKYLESGQRYFEKGKYREAAIQFGNAVQVDPRFTEAHYRLAQSYLRLRNGNQAFQELDRTIQLEPDHLQAHLD